MTLHVGDCIWIPCEVKPGPFSDERRVRIASDSGEWLGYVPVSYLQEPILEGQTKIRALIVDVSQDTFCAKIPGERVAGKFYGALISRAQAFDPVPARHSHVSG